jgi:hypothetical protein
MIYFQLGAPPARLRLAYVSHVLRLRVALTPLVTSLVSLSLMASLLGRIRGGGLQLTRVDFSVVPLTFPSLLLVGLS